MGAPKTRVRQCAADAACKRPATVMLYQLDEKEALETSILTCDDHVVAGRKCLTDPRLPDRNDGIIFTHTIGE